MAIEMNSTIASTPDILTPRSRYDFSQIQTSVRIPNLIEVQRESYERFL